MDIEKKILKLVIRFLFYGYFTTWSFCIVSILQSENSNKLLQDNVAYLVPSEYNFSFLSGNEESNLKFYHSGKYLSSSSLDMFRLSGNYYNIQSGKPSILNNKHIYRDYTRPPPAPFSLTI